MLITFAFSLIYKIHLHSFPKNVFNIFVSCFGITIFQISNFCHFIHMQIDSLIVFTETAPHYFALPSSNFPTYALFWSDTIGCSSGTRQNTMQNFFSNSPLVSSSVFAHWKTLPIVSPM